MAKADQLKALLNELSGRTLAAQLQDLMPDIDQKIREGVRHQDIIDLLNKQGFDLTLTNFRSILYRYRKTLLPGKPGAAPQSKQNRNSDVGPVEAHAEEVFKPEPSLHDILRNEQARENYANQFMKKKPLGLGRSK